MCGICGVVALGRPPERETVDAISALLAHRGPDDIGAFAEESVALGFRRLAILDLSPAGNQPFASDDRRLQLIHNGEIYNYLELRRELESHGRRFHTGTDTEVLLAAYEEWGERCVERFNGIWAFALWDGRARKLFCSRDRFGVKPFYYRHANGRLVFASEVQAFAADPHERLEPNTFAVREYLEQSYLDHTDDTFVAGVHRLPPAHSLVLDENGLRVRRYWSLEPQDPPAGDAEEAFRALFLDSVRLQLRSDVAVGTALSGGLDSSAIAASVGYFLRTESDAATAVGAQQRTFTAYFDTPGFDERPYARAVVEQTDADAHWVTFDSNDLVSNLPAIVRAQGEPFGSTSIAAGWYIMRAAHEAGLTVMLDGQGGDELLGGYRAHLGFLLADLLAGGHLAELRREFGALRDRHSLAALVTATARPFAPEALTRFVRGRSRGSATLVHPELRTIRADAAPGANGSPFPDRFRRYRELLLTRRGLPELLRYEDRNSMAHGIEARVPFLDHRLAELAFSLPANELIRRGRTKDVLRRALSDLLPPSVRDRTDKLGFVTPERAWFRGALGDYAEEVFASRSFQDRGFVDQSAALDRLRRHRRGEVDAGMELWRSLNVELWAREILDR
jgi:asparagine synthase (glutamine-hydrolysing)